MYSLNLNINIMRKKLIFNKLKNPFVSDYGS